MVEYKNATEWNGKNVASGEKNTCIGNKHTHSYAILQHRKVCESK